MFNQVIIIVWLMFLRRKAGIGRFTAKLLRQPCSHFHDTVGISEAPPEAPDTPLRFGLVSKLEV